jgi:hypothetical protein
VIEIYCMGDSKLYDKEFDRSNIKEEYMFRASNTATQTQGSDEVEGENEVNMNIICDRDNY